MRRGALLLPLLVSAAWAQGFTIAGVVQHPDGSPAKRVRMAIATENARENQFAAVITAADGLFRFDHVPAGKFKLTAEPPSGRRQSYGERSLGSGFGTAIVTGPGLRSDNAIIRLIPTCAIHGRVTDAEGEPVERALVQLFASPVMRGRRSTFFAGSHYTNDRGEYRFGGMASGTYYVAVAGQPWYANRGSESLSRLSYGTTFYPASRDPRGAAPLRLKPGQEIVADFSVVAAPAATLTVTVKGVDNGSAHIDLVREGVAGSLAYSKRETINTPRPAEIKGVEPGRYTVRTQANRNGKFFYTAQVVTIGTADSTIEMTLAEAPPVSGKLWIEDGPIPENAYVELENEGQGAHLRRVVGADGTFEFPSVPPGRYRVFAATASRMVHLRSVTLDGTLATEEMFEIAKPARLELLAILKGGHVNGTVTRKGEPAAGALALLAPKRESQNPLDYFAFQVDGDGTFEFDGLPAGDYFLIVLDDWSDFEYGNPAAVRPHLDSAHPVRVEANQTQKLRIELP